MGNYANNETIDSKFYERQKDEIHEMMKGKLQADCWVNSIILKKILRKQNTYLLGYGYGGILGVFTF